MDVESSIVLKNGCISVPLSSSSSMNIIVAELTDELLSLNLPVFKSVGVPVASLKV